MLEVGEKFIQLGWIADDVGTPTIRGNSNKTSQAEVDFCRNFVRSVARLQSFVADFIAVEEDFEYFWKGKSEILKTYHQNGSLLQRDHVRMGIAFAEAQRRL